jgi:tetrahydromethanopterin S-methyltransferase subunit E
MTLRNILALYLIAAALCLLAFNCLAILDAWRAAYGDPLVRGLTAGTEWIVAGSAALAAVCVSVRRWPRKERE